MTSGSPTWMLREGEAVTLMAKIRQES
jgi:hypothetical protein